MTRPGTTRGRPVAAHAALALLLAALSACGDPTPAARDTDGDGWPDVGAGDTNDAGPDLRADTDTDTPTDTDPTDVDAADTNTPTADADTSTDTDPTNDTSDAGPVDAADELPRLVLSATAETVAVGQEVTVRCRAEFDDGTAASGVPARLVLDTPELAVRTESGAWQARASGEARFRCTDQRGVLAEPPPLVLTFTTGAATRLVAQVDSESVIAGTPLGVTCLGFDAFGAPLGTVPGVIVARVAETGELAVTSPVERQVALRRAVPHEISCSSPTAIDTPSVRVEVTPAAPVGLRIEPRSLTLVAGTWTTFECAGEDAFGNATGAVEASYVAYTSPETVRTDPETRDREFRAFRTTTTGPYRVRCETEALSALDASEVTLVPSEVARMGGYAEYNGTTLDEVLPRVPPGSFIFPRYVVADRWRNFIEEYPNGDGWEATLTPGARATASGWVVDTPGAYEIHLAWRGADGAILVEERIPFFVDGGGPLLRCQSPADGAWTDLIPGETVAVSVVASDPGEVAGVTVDGQAATPGEDGTWTVERVVQPGINLLDVRAADGFGVESAVACAFLASYGYTPTETPAASTAAIAIGNEALDDEDRADRLDSLADLLLATLAGEQFIAGLEGPLTETDPLFADSLDLGVFTIDAAVTYEGGFDIGGPNDVGLRIVDGAVELPLTIRNLGLDVEVDLDFLGTSTGRITAPRIATSATILFTIEGGVATAVVDELVPTEVDELTADFDRPLFNTAFGLAESSLRSDLAAQLDATLEESLADIVSSSLVDPEVFSMVSEFEVAPLDEGGTPLVARLVASLGSGAGERDDLVLRLDSRFEVDGPALRVAPGVPLVTPGDAPPDVDGVGVFINPTLLNQGFVALWESGFFDATVFDFSAVFELAPDATIGEFAIRPDLPPLISLRDGRVVLTLGAVYTDVLDIFYGDGVVDARFAAEVSAVPAVGEDGQLVFEDVRVDRALASLQPLSFTPSDYERITNGLLDATLDGFVSDIFGATLPELPTLSLPGSEDLAPFGLGPDDVLTITSPTAYATDDWIVLEGPLGIE